MIFFLFLLNASHSAETPSETRAPVYLEVGEQRLLPFTDIDRYAVSGPAIRHKRLSDPDRLLVKAVAPGAAQITAFAHNGAATERQIRVRKRSSAEPNELALAVSRLDHIEVISVGTNLALRGPIPTQAEAAKVALIKQRFPKETLDQTTIAPELRARALSQIRDLLRPFPELRIEEESERIRVSGVFKSSAQAAKMQTRAMRILPLIDWEAGQLGGLASAIYFRVFLLSLTRENTMALGITWPQELPLRLNAIPLAGWFNDGIESKITALEASGSLKVLSKPELVVRAPGSAELFSGGEFPIQQQTRSLSQVQWRNYGLSLKLKVENVADPELRLTIETELSQIDRSNSEGTIPSLKANRMKTEVDAVFAQPLLLCGLTQQSSAEARAGIPILSQIPILSPLFGQSAQIEEHQELVAVLIPYRAPPIRALARVENQAPGGYIPLPRSQISGDEIESLKKSVEWPWNVFP